MEGAQILLPATIQLMRTNQLTGQLLQDYHDTMKPAAEVYGLGMRVHLEGEDFPIGEFC